MRFQTAHVLIFFFALIIGMMTPVKAMAAVMGQWTQIPWFALVLKGLEAIVW